MALYHTLCYVLGDGSWALSVDIMLAVTKVCSATVDNISFGDSECGLVDVKSSWDDFI